MERPNESLKPGQAESKHQERTGEMTENEKKVLENLRGVVDWFNRYQADNFDLEPSAVDPKNQDLRQHFADFEKEFSRFESEADEQEVLSEAESADIVFLGDYHNLLKNQKFSAGFIEKLAVLSPRANVLAVEFVDPKKQKFLNAYLAGKLDEKTFLKKINFAGWDDLEHWEGYKRLLESAKKHSMPVYGIRVGPGLQKERDEIFAELLGEISKNNLASRVLVSIGDIHLARGGLPKSISELPEMASKKSFRIVQNVVPLYFAALERYRNFKIPKVLKVVDGAYNIFTAPIITRLISDIENLNYVVGENEDALPPELWTELVARIKKMTGFNEPEQDTVEAPEVYFGREADDVFKKLKKRFSGDELSEYERVLEQKGCVYLPSAGKRDKTGDILIIKRFRLKRVLEEFAKFVFWPEKKGEDFLYFCSKMFIPERIPETVAEQAGEKMFLDFLYA